VRGERIRVVKLSGAGNDFIAIGPEAIAALGADLPWWVRRVCRRGLSVGADGVLLVEPLGQGRVRVRFHNPDGSLSFCGNGTRCAARFAELEGYLAGSAVLDTLVGDVPAEITPDFVRLTLPAPHDLGRLRLEVAGGALDGRWIRAGVPHFVVFVPDVAAAPLAVWGPHVRRHPAFGEDGTNLDVVGRSGEALTVRTWERGVEGETLSCGTGAVASAYALWLAQGRERVRVRPASGVPLEVRFTGTPEAPGRAVLEGDARVVFEGTLGPGATEGGEP
jgi:diaminopimelate epimerase